MHADRPDRAAGRFARADQSALGGAEGAVRAQGIGIGAHAPVVMSIMLFGMIGVAGLSIPAF
jgi:hypothetical protein